MEQFDNKPQKIRPKKGNGYSNAKSRTRRNKKQKEADLRAVKYDNLTKNEKIALIKSRRGQSKKELAKVLNSK